MSNDEGGTSKPARFFATPQTRIGQWSVGLAVAFLVLFMLWLFYIGATPKARPTFFSDPVHAVMLLGAAASAVAGAVLGAVAIAAKRERSYMVLLSVLVGSFVLWWAIAEAIGH
ncbi:MAG TPA: hypothetical protein VK837_00050 [Longimicrobiales bacterium]|nr:hypothetical protein [Longimicrobiales bacterium]